MILCQARHIPTPRQPCSVGALVRYPRCSTHAPGVQMSTSAQQQRCVALTGRCYEMGGAEPFIPFVELLEQCAERLPVAELRDALGDAAPEVARLLPELRKRFPDIPPPLEMQSEQRRRFLFKSVTDFFERAAHALALVVLLDDLQWADESTLLLLQHLAPHLEQMPMLMLGTYRDVELDLQRPFAQVLETLTRQRLAKRITVRRLPETSVREVLVALGWPSPPPALVESIFAGTEGNPFFVEEVFHHLAEEGVLFGDREPGAWRTDLDVDELQVPKGVRLVLARRLRRVGEETQRVLTAAAVVGRSFSLSLLEALGDVTGDTLLTALEEAEAAHLIVGVGGRETRWEFSHALIRQTLAQMLSLPRRQQLHQRIAEAIEATTPDALETRAAELAHHLYQAGTAVDAGKTVSVLQRAAEQVHGQGGVRRGARAARQRIAPRAGDGAGGQGRIAAGSWRRCATESGAERARADRPGASRDALRAGGGRRGHGGQVCWEFAVLCAWRADNARGDLGGASGAGDGWGAARHHAVPVAGGRRVRARRGGRGERVTSVDRHGDRRGRVVR